MIKDIVSNEEVKRFFKNELKLNKKSGTYLFYGSDSDQLLEFALYFSKGLCCDTLEDDFCDTCNVCQRIDRMTYGDLEVVEDVNGIKVDTVRELGYKSSSSASEGKRKIFILKDIQKLKKEAGNSLLKLIEEPAENSFFILLTNSLNILPTIKSRSILVKIKKRDAEELDVDEFTYNFFLGNNRDIENFKISDIDLQKAESYEMIGVHLKKYEETEDFKEKVYIYKCIKDFINNRHYLAQQEKLYFAEEILRGTNDRNLQRKIIEYTVSTLGNLSGLEDRLKLKSMLRFPVNMKLVLINLFLVRECGQFLGLVRSV